MSFEKMMEELRRDYINSLPQKIADIQNHLDRNDHSVLRDDFHKLKGTGKTYGLPEVSELAEVVENICARQPTMAPQAVRPALELLKAIHAARRENRSFSLTGHADFVAIRRLAGLD